MNLPVRVRTMEVEEFDAMRELSVDAFGGNGRIGHLLDSLHTSWAWDADLSFVADRGGEIIGHVLYTHAMLDAPHKLEDVLVLSPIGVRPGLQGLGIGGEMITATLRLLNQRGESLVFLEGRPTYYSRFGFQRAADLGFVAPSARIPRNAFMVYPLSRYEPRMTGALIYPDAFWRCDSVGLRREEMQADVSEPGIK